MFDNYYVVSDLESGLIDVNQSTAGVRAYYTAILLSVAVGHEVNYFYLAQHTK